MLSRGHEAATRSELKIGTLIKGVMNKALFVGGSHDGEKIAVADNVEMMTMPSDRIEVRREIYQRIEIKANSAKVSVYAISGMPGDVVITSLINGYKKPWQ